MNDWRVYRDDSRFYSISVEQNDLWLDWHAETPDGSEGWYRVELPDRGIAITLEPADWALLRDGMARMDTERGQP